MAGQTEAAGGLARVLVAAIRGYQLVVSPMFAPSCRFYPSCSQYARDALVAHGAWRGSTLAAARIARCHPWHDGGYDPVPNRKG